MVEFKSSELSERNYREGDSVFIKFVIRRLNEKDNEMWLYCEENNGASLWLNSNESVLHGEPHMYRDGDIIDYHGRIGKIVKGLNNDWYVLVDEGQLYDLNPNHINSVIKDNNVI